MREKVYQHDLSTTRRRSRLHEIAARDELSGLGGLTLVLALVAGGGIAWYLTIMGQVEVRATSVLDAAQQSITTQLDLAEGRLSDHVDARIEEAIRRLQEATGQ